MTENRGWFLTGLFFTTFSTLALEILDTRLLSVLTWYHLSFFAVSIAMLGMAAGAVHVYLGGARFEGEAAPRALARWGTALALSIPVTHVASLCVPIPDQRSWVVPAALGLTTLFLAVPFYLSGVIVSVALTRIPGPIGQVYAVDLLGASLGSIAVLGLLGWGDITSATFVCGVLAGVGAVSFRAFARRGGIVRDATLVAILLGAAFLNNSSGRAIRVVYPKGEYQPPHIIEHEFWTIHGQVIAREPRTRPPFYWGEGLGAEDYEVERITMFIDGAAGTAMTGFDGSHESLQWVKHDVTSLPYHLRRGGDVAVIGMGGGRDVLTALWAESASVVGIEINRAFLDLLEGPLRTFANLADRPGVRLVHDEARSFLTRTRDRYDVVQMSLIDTWAATGAGAFTLSENGLYTLEAWEILVRTLKPDGLLSVSRWYSPDRASETSRLVALATAALLRLGVEDPGAHMALAARDRVATLLLSPTPLSAEDRARLDQTCGRLGFALLLSPGREAAHPLLARIASSRSASEIRDVVKEEPLDYTPPTDERPFFFNLLKPASLLRGRALLETPGVIRGNLTATFTLFSLLLIVAALVVVVIFGPLLRTGRPDLDGRSFAMSVLYFALIGTGFMLIQIGLMQRFSVYLGHPIYALAIILFSMILATGLGSFLSDRVSLESSRWRALPILTALALLIVSLAVRPVFALTIQYDLLARSLIVVALVAPVALLLGTYFPLGVRLVGGLSGRAMPWMWGVNGACGVLASVGAVAISMWSGIQTNFAIALVAYLVLAWPASYLWEAGRRRRGQLPSP